MSEYCKGKTAWVTGSSRGIGRAIAKALAEQGCSVILHGRNQTNLRTSGEGDTLDKVAEEIAAEYHVRTAVVCGALTDEKEVARCVEEIHAKMGQIHFLICCAGGGNLKSALDWDMPRCSAFDFELEFVRNSLDQNLLSAMLCCRAVVPEMLKNGFGRIVTVGSIAGCGGHKTEGDAFFAYSLAKNGVQQYTRLLAAKLRHDNIPVNCIIPGNINTPSTRLRFGGDRVNPVDGLSRLEHVGKPEDIAALAAFLCDKGGEYITGQLIRVDGGEQLSPC